MVYVISDIHGHYDKYLKMLELICFSDTDELYILGDSVDRGPKPITLLRDMSMRTNIFPLIGNHDYMAECLLRLLNREITTENFEKNLTPSTIEVLTAWLSDGGDTTVAEFKKLLPEEREYLLEYFEEFSPYEELTVGENRFVLVHGGLPDFDPVKPLSEYDEFGFMTERPDYSKRYFSDRYLVTGHTPTLHIGAEYNGKIYQKNGHIAIDCGAGWGNALGCVRLDDFCEFYVP